MPFRRLPPHKPALEADIFGAVVYDALTLLPARVVARLERRIAPVR